MQGDPVNMPMTVIDSSKGVEGGFTPKYNKFGEYRTADQIGNTGKEPGFYTNDPNNIRVARGSNEVWQNMNKKEGNAADWAIRRDPLAQAGKFGDITPDIKIPGITAEEFAKETPENRTAMITALYNPEYAGRLSNTPLGEKMKGIYSAFGKGENPDFRPAFSPKLTFGTPYEEGDKGYKKGSYNYGGFKDFGDASTFLDEYKKGADSSSTGIRDKFLNTPDYYASMAEGKGGFTPSDSVYIPQAPMSRGGSQGSPDRLEQLGNYTNWSGAVPKSWEKKVKDTWRDFTNWF